jgi:hypothetical protein
MENWRSLCSHFVAFLWYIDDDNHVYRYFIFHIMYLRPRNYIRYLICQFRMFSLFILLGLIINFCIPQIEVSTTTATFGRRLLTRVRAASLQLAQAQQV